jgi:hypothetical protein
MTMILTEPILANAHASPNPTFNRYDASEDNEISFSEGDRITTITAASDDWWEGTAPNGKVGLFPANYVEVQE